MSDLSFDLGEEEEIIDLTEIVSQGDAVSEEKPEAKPVSAGFDLDDLLGQLDEPGDSFNLGEEEAEKEADVDALAEAIAKKREAFNADMQEESANENITDSDLDALLGLDSEDASSDEAGVDDLDALLGLVPEEKAPPKAPVGKAEPSATADPLDDLDSLLGDSDPEPAPQAKSADPLDDLDALLGADTGDEDAFAGDLDDLLGLTPESKPAKKEHAEEFHVLDDILSAKKPTSEEITQEIESLQEAEPEIEEEEDTPFVGDLDDLLGITSEQPKKASEPDVLDDVFHEAEIPPAQDDTLNDLDELLGDDEPEELAISDLDDILGLTPEADDADSLLTDDNEQEVPISDLDDILGLTPEPEVVEETILPELEDLDALLDSAEEEIAQDATEVNEMPDEMADLDSLLDDVPLDTIPEDTHIEEDASQILAEAEALDVDTTADFAEEIAEVEVETDVEVTDEVELEESIETESVETPIIPAEAEPDVSDIIETMEESASTDPEADINIESEEIEALKEEFEIDLAPAEDVLIVEDEIPTATSPVSENSEASEADQGSQKVVKETVYVEFDNTQNQAQLDMLFSDFRLLSSEIEDVKLAISENQNTANTEQVESEIAELQASLESLQENFASSKASLDHIMQTQLDNDDETGSTQMKINTFIMEMSDRFDEHARGLAAFEGRLSELESSAEDIEEQRKNTTSLESAEQKLDALVARIDTIEASLAELATANVKSDESESHEDSNRLTERLESIESTLAQLENMISSTAARIIREEIVALLEEDE